MKAPVNISTWDDVAAAVANFWDNLTPGFSSPGAFLLERIEQQPALLYVLLTIGLFLLLTITFAGWMLISRRTKRKRTVEKALLQEKYGNYLAELVSGDYEDDMLQLLSADNEATLALNREDTHHPFKRKVLLEEILILHRNLSGKDASKLREVYLTLGYKQEALKNLHKKSWYAQALAIKELTQMDIRDAYQQVIDLMQHQDERVRQEAMLASLKLTNTPLSFLKDYQFYLNDWQQAMIHREILSWQDTLPPDFSQWFQHQNESVKVFAFRMAGLFDQFHNDKQLAQALPGSAAPSCLAGLKALQRIGSAESLSLVQTYFFEQTTVIRIAAINTAGSIGSSEHTHLLEDLLSETDMSVVKAAAKAICQLDAKHGTDRLERLSQGFESNNQLVLEQVIGTNR